MMTKKLWLDDERPEPPGWIRAKTASEAISLLATNAFLEVSLDHDLGPESAGTGYEVACWIEEAAMNDQEFTVPTVYVHTANPSAKVRMNLAVRNIELIRQQRMGDC